MRVGFVLSAGFAVLVPNALADRFEDYVSEIEMTCINEDGEIVSLMSKSGDVIMDGASVKTFSSSFEKKEGEERYIAKADGGGFEVEFYFDFEDRRAAMTMFGQRINMQCF